MGVLRHNLRTHRDVVCVTCDPSFFVYYYVLCQKEGDVTLA
jgi:hypothetical protein